MSTLNATLNAVCTAQALVDTPLGAMRLARTAKGLAGLWFEGQKHHPGELHAPLRPDDTLLHEAAQQLRRYFAGEASSFDLPLDLQGTPFQCSVWQALRRIPAGRTCSYAELARTIGAPRAVRAVGAAIGRNPASLVVPCHRVIGGDGSLTGYAGGLPRKRSLLALESRA
ncbi:methylated-DNA--[protein]-cysteine S-methyltransferase [uncultured Piscinibacter sp.]|uniref:methylated-DNA--[protein]-cysteine S-methyltransferase n=1 Tax=uncultured Piscinibacter sp. TaxID=1131835 RepID=UPI002622E278|nr:methylated-DNA--[protein]-cysteine S-methyltransferase [uncultured Piscinibacter sp.]